MLLMANGTGDGSIGVVWNYHNASAYHRLALDNEPGCRNVVERRGDQFNSLLTESNGVTDRGNLY